MKGFQTKVDKNLIKEKKRKSEPRPEFQKVHAIRSLKIMLESPGSTPLLDTFRHWLMDVEHNFRMRASQTKSLEDLRRQSVVSEILELLD